MKEDNVSKMRTHNSQKQIQIRSKVNSTDIIFSVKGHKMS